MTSSTATPRNEPINGLVGVPYKLGSRDPAQGLDCWTLVLEVYRAAGLPVPPHWDATQMSRADIARAMRRESTEPWVRRVPTPQLFDLVADVRRGHVGIWLDGGMVLHADRQHGVRVVRLAEFLVFYPRAEFFTCR